MRKQLTFSFIIPIYNEQKKIGLLLDSLIKASVNYTKEILVVDSGSTDKTISIIQKCQKKYSFIKLKKIRKEEFHRSRTRNEAIKETSGKFICFCTGHAIPIDLSFPQYFLDGFKLNDKVVAVFGEDITYDNAPIVERIESICKMKRLSRHCTKQGILVQDIKHPFIPFTEENKYIWYFLSNIFTCYRRDFLQKYPFPEANYGEDVLLGKMIIDNGYVKIYDRRCGFIHYHEYNFSAYVERQKDEFNLKYNKFHFKEKVNIRCKIIEIFKLKISLFKKIYYVNKLFFYYCIKILIMMRLALDQKNV